MAFDPKRIDTGEPRAFGFKDIGASDNGKWARIVFEESEEHTSELQSLRHLVCRLLLEKKKTKKITPYDDRTRKMPSGTNQKMNTDAMVEVYVSVLRRCDNLNTTEQNTHTIMRIA